MEPKREQALVGLFVLMAAGVLIATIFAITGAFGPTAKIYHAHFPFAGGLEPGAIVRYSGGPKVGRVEQLRINPQDPGQIDVTFSVRSDLALCSLQTTMSTLMH
jgi:ABC-type transporter Mla subunit MlaD